MYWHVFPCASTRLLTLRVSHQPTQLGCPAAASTASSECAGSKSRSCQWGHGTGRQKHHDEQECQRSAKQSAAPNSAKQSAAPNSVLEENLEDCQRLHEQRLECQRSAPRSARRCAWESGWSALPPTVPPSVERDPQSAEG